VTPPAAIMQEVAGRLRAAKRVAVLTGAGISAESGVPTFRDALTGLWARFRPEELATPEAFARDPALVWRWYRMRRDMVRAAEPNAGHRALVELPRHVPRFTLITQNVDALHRRAGSTDVVELHGDITRARCAGACPRDTSLLHESEWTERDDGPPLCSRCSAASLRPDVVWFGEMLPPAALERATAEAGACDLFLSVGTSNVVEPAASLPWLAARAGAAVVVVNPDMAGQRSGANIHHLAGPAGTILPQLVRAAFPESSASA